MTATCTFARVAGATVTNGAQCPLSRGWHCVDCNFDTFGGGEYYMVTATVWESAGMEYHGGALCIGCLERRIGRALTPSDFPKVYPINSFIGGDESVSIEGPRLVSDRLLSRATRPTRPTPKPPPA